MATKELPSWRRPDGSIIWCDAPGPAHRTTGHIILCALVVGHDGSHENGTSKW
jgi:hypothetical protein